MNIPPILYIYEGRMNGVGCDLDVYHHLKGLSEAGILVDFISRGKVDLPGISNFKTVLALAKPFSSCPSPIYSGARRRCLSHLGSRAMRRKGYGLAMAWAQSGLPFVETAKKQGIPSMLHYGNLHLDFEGPPKPEALWPRIGGSHVRREIEIAETIVVPSEFCRSSFLAMGVPGEKVKVSLRGADLSRYGKSGEIWTGFRVVCLGRVCERKGVEQLLDAWEKADLVGAELWFAGSIEGAVQPLVDRWKGKNGIQFLGFCSNPAEVLKDANVSVLLSRNEGLAKTLIESAATGLPLICTKESGFPMEDGFEGFVVNRNKPEETAEALKFLFQNQDQAARMGRKNRERASEIFSWEKSRKDFVALIRAAMSSGRNFPS